MVAEVESPIARAVRPRGCVDACPGCRHRDWPAARSLAQKQAYLRRALAPWSDRLEAPLGAEESARLGYRDRVSLHCEWQEPAWHAGLRQRDDLVPLARCPVHSRRVNDCLALLLPRLPAPAAGFALRYYVQAGAQLTLVLKQAGPPPLEWLDAALCADLARAGLEGLWLQLYPSAGYHKFTKRGWRLLWGQPRSRDADGLVHGPASFGQLIPALHRAALDQAEAFLQPAPGISVLDLYCGNGASLRRWSQRGAATLGVELNGEAVDNARRNAPAARLLRGRCGQRLPQVSAWLAEAPGPLRLYCNPPRSGLEPAVLQWLVSHGRPQRLAYMACSAGTLARDLASLSAHGYQVRALRGFDFFPLTHHVEVLALLARRRSSPDGDADSATASP